MSQYGFSQPWLSMQSDPATAPTAMEFAHLRSYLNGIDNGTIPLFSPKFQYPTFAGGITVNGTITFSPTTAGIVGTTTNDNAAAGNVGEYIVATKAGASVNFPATSTYGDLLNITLTAGDWDVTGILEAMLNSSTMNGFLIGISTTTGNSSTGLVGGDTLAVGQAPTNNFDSTLIVPNVRFSLASTTTVYLKMYAQYTVGQPQASGRMSARRIR
jgi:hypothetical protein